MDRLGIGWELTSITGWGVYGLNLARNLGRRPDGPWPALLRAPKHFAYEPDDEALFQQLFKEGEALLGPALRSVKPGEPHHLPYPMLHQLADDLQSHSASEVFKGTPDFGVIFFENTNISAMGLSRARRYRRVIAGSGWNAEVLRGAGIEHVDLVHQGVDTRLFRPLPRKNRFAGRFKIFSGGKLEHRKGQDLVIAAFRAFLQIDPDALLVTAWSNPWPEKRAGLGRDGHVMAPPQTALELDVPAWLEANGIPRRNVHDLGQVANQTLPGTLSDMDCAVFASRYESGTNLPAMEAMACGLPVILSSNTGHLDLIGPDRCIALERQQPVAAPQRGIGTDGWGGSSVEEIVEALKTLRFDSERRAACGAKARAFMADWDWSARVDHLVETVRVAL